MPNGRAILVFTRAPEAEARVKRLPVAEGSRLFVGFLQSWQKRAHDTGADLLVVTPASSKTALARLLPNASIAAQSGESFSARVEAAFALAFDRGASTVLMVGGDSPPLESPDLHRVFSHLESHDRALVLTPSADGGVNAIGFNAEADRPLAGITWQSSDVCRQLASEGARGGLTLLLTAAGHDLDCAANIAALYRLSRIEYAWSVFRWLLRSLLLVCRSAPVVVPQIAARIFIDARATRGPPCASLA